MPFDSSPAVCKPRRLNYGDGTGDHIHLFGNEIISAEHHYKFHGFSFEPPLTLTSRLQVNYRAVCKLHSDLIQKLTNGQFLHTPLHPSMLCLLLFTARFLNATFVPVYSQRGFFCCVFSFSLGRGLQSAADMDFITLHCRNCPSKNVCLLKTNPMRIKR